MKKTSYEAFAADKAKPSLTEEMGLGLLTDGDLNIVSIGVSTLGHSEVRMLQAQPERTVVATTLDEAGAQHTEELFKQFELSDRATVLVEDVAKQVSADPESVDFVYARLVLHYLPDQKLTAALQNIFDVMKPGAGLYIVVRSYDWESEVAGAVFNPATGLTTIPHYDRDFKVVHTSQKRLHTVGSLTHFVREAGFEVQFIESLEERIYGGYKRERRNAAPSKLIHTYVKKN